MKAKPHILYLTTIAAVLFLLFRQCDQTREAKRSKANIAEYLLDTLSYYQNKEGQWVAEKKALQGDKSALEVLLDKQIDRTGQLKRLVRSFRNVDAAGNVTTVTKIDTIPIPYEVEVPCKFTREFGIFERYYTIEGTSNKKGISLNEISIPNTLSFAIGDKKTGFFKSEYRIEVVNSNPYITTTGLDAYTLQVPKKRFGFAVFAGYGITESGLSPMVGVGFSYQLLRF